MNRRLFPRVEREKRARARHAARVDHPGIEIAVYVFGAAGDRQPILRATSDVLHGQALFRGMPPGADLWTELLPTLIDAQGRPQLRIEYRPVRLVEYDDHA